jgi:circadian clock protein KaiC
MTQGTLDRLTTGVRHLDPLLGGGLPRGSITVLAGPPGSGKTILAHQICFHAAAESERVLYLQTLSEPTAKTLLYLREFEYFDQGLFEERIKFVDMGTILRARGLEQIGATFLEHVQAEQPSVVVVDSFKIFDDLASSPEELRKVGYEIAVNLMAWECTTLLLGEYAPRDYETNPLFSIIDGLITLKYGELAGEQQRTLQIVKMRGTEHARDPFAFEISSSGVRLFAPRLLMRPSSKEASGPAVRTGTGVAGLDDLLGAGIPRGSSLLVSGAAGTGKTALLLEVLYRGATIHREKGVFFSFDETEERLRAAMRGFGWDVDAVLASGLLEIVAIPQPDIRVEPVLAMMDEKVAATGAKRVAVDSISVFLHNLGSAELVREKVYQLTTLVQRAGALGLFATDIPYGVERISRYGVEETVVDGVVILSAIERGLDRRRFVEIYKLRNAAHLQGRHVMTIGTGGMRVYPRYGDERAYFPPHPFDVKRRLGVGIEGFDTLLGGGVLERSVTLVSGSTGIGKSTMCVHFALAGASRSEPVLYIAREEGPKQILASAEALGLPLNEAVASGAVELLYLSREDIRAAQLLTILTAKVQARSVRRLILDSATRLESDDLDPSELPQLLYALAVRFKALGVTSLFTLEAKSMFTADLASDQGLSPIADNLVLMRYAQVAGALEHTVSVIKTRGSAHETGRFAFRIARGGIELGARLRETSV